MFRVISKKLALNGSPEFLNYVHLLAKAAKVQPGFVDSKSFSCVSGGGGTYIISDWRHRIHWQTWQKSSDRADIYAEYKNFIAKEEFEYLQSHERKINMFLM